ncbi:hypothetical protein ACHAWF_000455 [Thalassiosira exigua]
MQAAPLALERGAQRLSLLILAVTVALKVASEQPAFVSNTNRHHGFSMRRSLAFNFDMVKDAEEKDYASPMRQRPSPKGGDVAYTQGNILRQLRYYNDIRQVGGKDCVQDIYARDPTKVGANFRYWFVGKVARCTGTVTPELAVARQFNLIEEHATRIRPIELGRSFGSLELFVASGDTEVLTSQNHQSIRLQRVRRPDAVDGANEVAILEVGLNFLRGILPLPEW